MPRAPAPLPVSPLSPLLVVPILRRALRAMVPDPKADSPQISRRLPVGVEVIDHSTTHARVWAPICGKVEVVLDDGRATALAPEGGGYFSGDVPGAGTGARYRFRLDGGDAFPDPVSRYQPDGPHGPSVVVDHGTSSGPTATGAARVGRPGDHGCRHVTADVAPPWNGCPAVDVGHTVEYADRRPRPDSSAGATTAESLRAVAPLQRARRFYVAHRRAHRARRHPRRGVQPLRSRRQLPTQVFADVFRRQADRVGRRDQLRRRRLTPGARILPRERALLDRGIPLRRPAARRHAADLGRVHAAHHRRGRGDRAPHRRHACDDRRRRERAAAREARAPARGGRLWARRDLERRLPSRRARRGERTQRSVPHRLPGDAAGIHQRGEIRFPYQASKVAARRGTRPRVLGCRRAIPCSPRTTIRSRNADGRRTS